MKMLVVVDATGPAFCSAEGDYEPELGVADILEDVAAQLRSGVKLPDLHMDKLRAMNGDRVGAILVSEYKFRYE